MRSRQARLPPLTFTGAMADGSLGCVVGVAAITARWAVRKGTAFHTNQPAKSTSTVTRTPLRIEALHVEGQAAERERQQPDEHHGADDRAGAAGQRGADGRHGDPEDRG